mgnify:CR=1 FL=1
MNAIVWCIHYVIRNTLHCHTIIFYCRSKEIKPFNLNQVIARGVGNSIYNTDDFILSALRTASVLLRKFISLYRDTPAAAALFSHAKSAVDRVNTDDYPKSLQVSVLISVHFGQCGMLNFLWCWHLIDSVPMKIRWEPVWTLIPSRV